MDSTTTTKLYSHCEVCRHKFPLAHLLKFNGKCYSCFSSNKSCFIL